MARTIELSEATIETLVRQISEFLPSAGLRLLAEENPELGETLQVWMLPANSIILAQPLNSAAPTGKWHHQIFRSGKPELFAYSQPYGPRDSDWQIMATFESEIPLQIDRAIEVAERVFADEEEARLLVIPAFNLQAIWGHIPESESGTIIPAVVPPEYRSLVEPLSSLRSAKFFERLRLGNHIQGIIPS